MNTMNSYLPRHQVSPILRVLSILLLLATSAIAQPNSTVVSYLSPGYRYQQVSWGAQAGFESPGFDDTSWPTGQAGFGSLFASCPLNTAAFIGTSWGVNTDMLIRKHFTLPGGARHVVVNVAIDNDLQVFINGRDISGGMVIHDGCAERDNFVFVVPDSILKAGDNLLAIRARAIAA